MSRSPLPAALLQDGIDAINEAVAALDLRIVVDRDFRRLRQFIDSQNGFPNPSYDPGLSRLGPDDFWLGVVDAGGQMVACSAERVVETGDFLELVANGRIWYGDGYAERFGVDRIETQAISTTLSGRISHSGSTFVAPAHRRGGLAMFLTYMSRALTFRDSGCTINTGFVRQSLASTTVPQRTYGYAHVELCLDGWWPPQGGSERLYLCWIGLAEFLAKLAELPDHPRHPMALPQRRRPNLTLVPSMPAAQTTASLCASA